MAFVICEPCIDTLDTSCLLVCPSDAIHPTFDDPDFASTDQLFINPIRCVNCGACADACPAGAIYPQSAVPAEWTSYIAKNADHFR